MNYDMSIHTNPDARAWAQFYCKTIKENPEIVIDESYMIAWFANAMMAMHDHLVLQGNPINGDHAEYMIESVVIASAENDSCGSLRVGDARDL